MLNPVFLPQGRLQQGVGVLHGQRGQRGDLVRQRAALQAGRGGLLGGIVHGLHVAQQLAVHLVFHKHKDLGVNALAAHPLDLLL